MKCPKCHFDCPPRSAYCPKCGQLLQQQCPQCSFQMSTDFAFCPKCGSAVAALAAQGDARTGLSPAIQRLIPKEYAERLFATRGAATAERRTVTILFCDVKGSTSLAERLDPEEWREIMNAAFEVLIAPVCRYEGTLARLMGDAILAFFGAPIAHEDDPERACRAALEITAEAAEYADKLGRERDIQGFNVRVGINTGLVVVGEVGSDLRVEYTAMGDAVNLAARMESAAEPGTVLITEATHKLIAPLFETKALGPLQVNGKVEPVAVYRVLTTKTAPGKVRGLAGLESPLVGREGEMQALREALERLLVGVGGVVTLVGEAGLGKSRLVAELRGASAASPVQWVEGRCLSYGGSIAYSLWLDVQRDLLRLSTDASPQGVQGVLRDRVRALCLDRTADVYPYLARLFSLPAETEDEARLQDLEGDKLKAGTFRALEAVLECAANRLPLVLVCEDLHWADPTSTELLGRLLALTDRVGLLFVCVFRPEKEHGSWHIREVAAHTYGHRHTDLWLKPLTTADGSRLLSNLLQMPTLLPAFSEHVLSYAEGNPLYVEEIVRSLIDRGDIERDEASGTWRAAKDLDAMNVPQTLQGVLTARIDRLQEDARRVLQMASVVGRIFPYCVLAVLVQDPAELSKHLLTLQRDGMIRERARIPELEYIFKHELTREAAYKGLLHKQRIAFHRQVAETLERLYPDRIEERLSLLAHHWEQAGGIDKAAGYLIRAGKHARRNYACTEALQHYALALQLAEAASLPQRMVSDILRQRAETYTSFNDMGKARQDLYRALELARLSRDRHTEAEILLDLMQPLLTAHDLGEGLACARQAAAIAASLGDLRLIARSTGALGSALCFQGQLREAHGYLQAALDSARTQGDTGLIGDVMPQVLLEKYWSADWRGVLLLVDEALKAAEELRSPSMAYGVCQAKAYACCSLGQYEVALADLAQAGELAKKAGITNAPAELLNSLGWVYQEVFDLQRSSQLNREAAEVCHKLGEIESEANALVNLGVDHLWLGELEQAEARFAQAWNLLEKQFGGYRWRWKTRLLAAWGESYLARGKLQEALRYAEQCLELAKETSSRKNMVKGWRLKGEALAAQGQLEEATVWLGKALAVAEEIGNPPLAWKSGYGLGRVLDRLGRHTEASSRYRQAAALIEGTAAGLNDPSLREKFLAAGPVQAVLAAASRPDSHRDGDTAPGE